MNNHTYYSLRYGALSIEELLEQAAQTVLRDESGWGKFVLTDINTTSAVLDFVRHAPAYQIHPVVGIDFRNGMDQQFIGIAQNNNGFLELNRFLSEHLHTKTPIPSKAPSLQDCFIIYPLESYTGFPLKPWEYVGVRPEQLLAKKLRNNEIPIHRLVALQSGSFRGKRDYNAHRLLRAIHNNTLLSKLPVEEQARSTDLIEPFDVFAKRFALYPRLLENTINLIHRAEISFEYGTPKNKKVFGDSIDDDFIQLQSLAYIGLSERYENPGSKEKNRLEQELTTIYKLGFTAYFLINWDMVQFARKRGFYHVGRGSGANSMVAYCLYITNVDPVDLDLYFERFINQHRKSPPDFDIDFSWTDRDEVINYLFAKHKPNHCAMLATYNTFKNKSAVREIGKVFGLPKNEIDVLTRYRPKHLDELSRLTLRYSEIIQKFPNHLGIHAGGVVISDLPIHYYTAQEFPPKGVPITQFSMYEAEDLGLHKFDVLSQRGLGKINDAIELVQQNHNQDLSKTIENIPLLKRDPEIKRQLKVGATIGCFYVESPGMRMLLSKLKADDYTRLVAASSIIRPGVAKSGMMREYIERFQDPERRKFTHPKLAELMAETYGVMVYQEDVLKVAHYFAGLTLEEADVLRRGMSWKFRERNEFHLIQEKFFSNCKRKGYDTKTTTDVWTQIESFGNYAFSKGHSASYAVESFQSLYIKAYYPLEYMVATINNGGGFYRRESYIHEARMHGGCIHGPCVNNSRGLTTIYEQEIFLGFGMVHELEIGTIKAIEKAKDLGGSFDDFQDFMDRVAVSKTQLNILIRVGAFRFTGKTKKELLWEACMCMGAQPTVKNELFRLRPKTFTIPDLHYYNYEDAHDEIALLGFPLSSPFELTIEDRQGHIMVDQMPQFLNQKVAMKGYFVFNKTTKTTTNQLMFFGTFYDEKGAFIDSVHFPKVAAEYPFRGLGVYWLVGIVREEFGYYSLEVESMEHLLYKKDERYD